MNKQVFAYYRLPFAEEYTRIIQDSGRLVTLHSVSAFGCHHGFAVAPFETTDECPIVVIEGEESTVPLPTTHLPSPTTHHPSPTTHRPSSKTYADTFSRFHAELQSGRFQKIVLARQEIVTEESSYSAEDLFFRACELYPRLFIALVSTPQTGTWLVATPEILLECNGDSWHTMALAGTMKLTSEQMSFDTPPTGRRTNSDTIRWSDKDISEQRYVATYIHDCLSRFTADITEEGPYTSRAGDLVHLRSDFSFCIKNDTNIGALLNALHPTPAVCGIPKDETKQFILSHEPTPRRYYSGFMGPLNTVNNGTHLYVTLRCMEIKESANILYAGGGLLPDSQLQREWEETVAKMQTMKRVFSCP